MAAFLQSPLKTKCETKGEPPSVGRVLGNNWQCQIKGQLFFIELRRCESGVAVSCRWHAEGESKETRNSLSLLPSLPKLSVPSSAAPLGGRNSPDRVWRGTLERLFAGAPARHSCSWPPQQEPHQRRWRRVRQGLCSPPATGGEARWQIGSTAAVAEASAAGGRR